VSALVSAPPPGLLTDALPVDVATLDAAVQEFLQRLDDIGQSLTAPLNSGRLYYWLAGAAAVGAALEFARRRNGNPAARPVGVAGLSDLPVPGLPISADLAAPEQA
jgi:hypothetical protein